MIFIFVGIYDTDEYKYHNSQTQASIISTTKVRIISHICKYFLLTSVKMQKIILLGYFNTKNLAMLPKCAKFVVGNMFIFFFGYNPMHPCIC